MIEAFFNQSPLVPLVFAFLADLIVIMQCISKRAIYKFRLIFSFIITAAVGVLLVFYNQILQLEDKFWLNFTNYSLIGIEFIIAVILFTSIDFSLSNEQMQRELTKSLDETKYFVLLDKKDRIKDISTLLLKDFDLSKEEVLKKNFFDVIEYKYRIIGINSTDARKDEIKRFYATYKREVGKNNNDFEINVEDDRGVESAMYFKEINIFSNSSYKGRILFGENKTNDDLIGMEKDLKSKSERLDTIKTRFAFLLNKTNDGIYFNDLVNKKIWFNDTLVKRLCLNGNTIATEDFYKNVHPEDKTLLFDSIKEIRGEYTLTYRYNTGSYLAFIKEVGKRIVTENGVELCGIMNVIDDYSFEHTDTPLDSIKGVSELHSKLKDLVEYNKSFLAVSFKINDIPTINEKYGRAIGTQMIAGFVERFKKNFAVENYVYRISGLEFVALITEYNKMESLKNYLREEDKLLVLKANYGSINLVTNIFMGLSYSNDEAPANAVKNATAAMKVASSPNYTSKYAYYKDIR